MASPDGLTPGRPKPILIASQQAYVSDKSRFKLGMFARQTGKTFSTTLECTDDVFEAELRKERSRWVILSRGERQAREAMEEGVQRHVEAYGRVLGKFHVTDWEYYESNGGVMIKRTALERTWPGGSRITALPASPDTARGFSANVIADEFAFHQNSRAIWQALFPVISAGWKMRVISTPNGKNNKFYELMTKNDPDFPWSRHVCDIHQAVAEGLPRDVKMLRAALDDEDAWAQEFELQWLDEASSWLSFDLINSVEHDRAGMPDQYQGGYCFVGVDIGIRRDLFVIWVGEMVGDVLWTRQVIAERRISFAEQDALLAQVMSSYRVARACMDQTGMGEKPVEDAQRRYGESVVEGVVFTPASKLVMATHGKQRFEDKQIRIPLGDEPLRKDLHKLKKETTLTGAPRFVAEDDAGGHADRTWACFLACYAAAGGPVSFGYTAGPEKGRKWDGPDGSGAGKLHTRPPSELQCVTTDDGEGAF